VPGDPSMNLVPDMRRDLGSDNGRDRLRGLGRPSLRESRNGIL
jgi:hypothetical protein